MIENISDLESKMVAAYIDLSKKMNKKNLTQTDFFNNTRYWNSDFQHKLEMSFNDFKVKHGFPCNKGKTKGKKYKSKKQILEESLPFRMVKCKGNYCGESYFKCTDLDLRGVPLWMRCSKCRNNEGVEI